MRRFCFRELVSLPAEELSAAFRARLTGQRSQLAAAATTLPLDLQAAASRLEKGLVAAEKAARDEDALAEAEIGAQAAVDDLKTDLRAQAGPDAQMFLNFAFSSLLSQRGILQAAQAAKDAESLHHLLMPVDEDDKGGLNDILCNAVEDAQAFCREKYGDSPETLILRVREARTESAAAGHKPGASAPRIFVPFIVFPLHEMLKNAYGAHCRLVGADRLDRCPPVEVRYGQKGNMAFVSVVDFGGVRATSSVRAFQELVRSFARPSSQCAILTPCVSSWRLCAQGFREESSLRPLEFLHTSNPEREANYTYSRNFGAPFEGLGMGLPLAKLHARYHGGDLHVQQTAGSGGRLSGVHVGFTFDLCTERVEPEPCGLVY